MNQEDLEREILKVTQQGGMARVPETTIAEAVGAGMDQEECAAEVQYWVGEFCLEHHLTKDQAKDIFGAVEMLFQHT